MYIDARRINGKVWISERTKQGIRKVHSHLPPYVFYYEDANGTHTSIHDTKLRERRFTKWRAFKNELDHVKDVLKRNVYESDINPVYRFLEERYKTDDAPPLNIAFLDIEVDKDPKGEFAHVTLGGIAELDRYANLVAIDLDVLDGTAVHQILHDIGVRNLFQRGLNL